MLRLISAALAFGVELLMLGAYGAFGLHLPFALLVRLLAAMVPVLAVGLLWGRYLSPRATHRLETLPRALGKVAVFAGGTAAAWTAGLSTFAIVIAVLAVVSLVLEFVAGVPPVAEPVPR